jgi:hypothetical protein
MGLLDELKAEAEALQSRQRRDEAAFERNALRTDEACKSVFHYWLDSTSTWPCSTSCPSGGSGAPTASSPPGAW